MRRLITVIGITLLLVSPSFAASGKCKSDAGCSDGLFCNGVERCASNDPRADAFGCVRPTSGVQCPLNGICDEATDRCLLCGDPDADGDGVNAANCGGADCDDGDPNRFPANTEICNVVNGQYTDHDEDCDPTTIGRLDVDNDGETDFRCCNANAAGIHICGADCDDSNGSVNPFVPEVCDGFDNNCNNQTDEGVSVSLYPDEDGDNHGRTGTPVAGCSGDPNLVTLNNDCDDQNPAIQPGSIVCRPESGAGAIKICSVDQFGEYSFASCPSGQICMVDPNGAGSCQPTN